MAADGSSTAIEQTRTALEDTYPFLGSPLTIGEPNAEARQEITGWQHDAAVVILPNLPIADCSLAVGVAAGPADRKRPFSPPEFPDVMAE